MSLLIDRFREEVSKLDDPRMSKEANCSVAYPTGFLNFDFKNGAIIRVQSEKTNTMYYSIGITDGSLMTVIGRSSSGKTTWVLQSAANIIRPFPNACIFEDSIEAGATLPRKELLTGFYGDELKKRLISRDSGITAENFYERVKRIHDIKINNKKEYEYDTELYDTMGNRIYKMEPTVYILDSLSLLMPEKFTEEETLSGQMSSTAAAKANAMIFKRIIPMLKAANIILMVINHINQDIQINPFVTKKAQLSYLKQGEVLPGGNAPIYLSNLLIRFDDVQKLKITETFGITGSNIEIGLIKSRSNAVGQIAHMVFDQEIGFDPDLSLLVMLKHEGRIGGKGAYNYLMSRPDLKFSYKEFKRKLYDNQELMSAFTDECLTILKNQLIEIDKRLQFVINLPSDKSASNMMLDTLKMNQQIAA